MTLRQMRILSLFLAGSLGAAAPVAASPSAGNLLGVVVADGSPQLGATVIVTSEQGRVSGPVQLLTNAHGLFRSSLVPGMYSVRVTLAGFLPTIEQHVRIDPRHTTLLKVELDSVFSALDRLRRQPDQKLDADEWNWVLRTSAATRPVLRWTDGEVVLDQDSSQAETARRQRPRGRVELTTGARRPGSVSNLADSPATAFVYDQGIGHLSRLLLAGQVSYEHSAAAGFALTWLPSGQADSGPATTLILRQSKLGPVGPTFRGARLEQDDRLELGDRVTLHYGAEYVLVSLNRSTSSLRPRATLAVRFSPAWRGSFILAAGPRAVTDSASNSLQSALNELDTLPTLLMRHGRPVLERAWHEEAALERGVGANASLTAAVFREHGNHTAIFGRGEIANSDFFQDFFSDAFAYDAGDFGSWGTRVAFQQKFSDDFRAAVVYAWAGTLSAEEERRPPVAELRQALQERYRHSLATRVSARVPRLGTQLAASYKWISGPAVTRPDAFGESVYHLDPYLNVSFRQPLPTFLCCRLEALADFRNLLAQGYVPVVTQDGRTLLISSARSFRGGLSVQF